MAVYTCTGYNDHYMYLNHGQQTIPNGLVRTWAGQGTALQGDVHPDGTYLDVPMCRQARPQASRELRVWSVRMRVQLALPRSQARAGAERPLGQNFSPAKTGLLLGAFPGFGWK